MDLIQLLPDSVANQIAAGEVIQRPASVIKELVENAVDAGAHRIGVLIVDAGRTSIQVIDDGQGMSETDARLAFERHATSKIRQADDLFALHTMGFRGEALPSIAAVSQVELLTRTAGDEFGTRLRLAASRVVSQEPASCPVGCNFRVDNLFYNVPARRKFLKSNSTELNNILLTFERIVLVYPDIHFTLHHNGAELLNLRPGSLRQRVADVFGHTFSQEMLPLSVDTALCRVSGFVGKPESARKKNPRQFFFVNGRFMRHPYFHKAVLSAYERLVPEGEQVSYLVYFDVSPADIDVNIHPTKTEIKFENEQAIWQLLTAAIRDAIGRFSEIPSIDFDTEGRPDIPVYDSSHAFAEAPRIQYNESYNPFLQDSPASAKPRVPADWQALYDGLGIVSGDTPASPPPSGDASAPSSSDSSSFVSGGFPAGTTVSPAVLPCPEEKSPLHYQYKGRYIMTAVKSGLMLIDQHRADVRILYERYLEQLRTHTANTQKLLFPDILQFSPSETVIMERILPDLTAMGFDLSDLGGGSFSVGGVPAGIEGLDPISLLRRMVSDAVDSDAPLSVAGSLPADISVPSTSSPSFSAGVGIAATSLLHRTLALSLATSAAIPYGQVLSNEEMEALVNQLFACSDVNHTPDGHLILSILPQSSIDRLFS